MPKLAVYVRQDCHLCGDMLDALNAYQTELGYTYSTYDIDLVPAHYDKYNALVPVVELDGQELFRYFFELETLRVKLAQNQTT